MPIPYSFQGYRKDKGTLGYTSSNIFFTVVHGEVLPPSLTGLPYESIVAHLWWVGRVHPFVFLDVHRFQKDFILCHPTEVIKVFEVWPQWMIDPSSTRKAGVKNGK